MALLAVPTVAAGGTLDVSWGNTYLRDNISELIGRSALNQAVNGAFRLWQRGATFATPAGAAYTADRWQVWTLGGLTHPTTVAQETTIVDTPSDSSLKIVTAENGWGLTQKIEHFAMLRGKTLAVRLRARQGVASAGRAFLRDSGGALTYGATKSTTGAFVDLECTKAIATNATSVEVGVEFSSAGTYYIDSCMLVVGPNPTEFVPEDPQRDLARCQRYYEVMGGTLGALSFDAYNAAGAVMGAWVPFAVPKGGTPTMTKNGTWQVTNCGQPTVQTPNTHGYLLSATVTALGAALYQCNSADDTVVAEWNVP